ncbi:predicted protein [Uncinocarpus reesii 1704]|uniref:Aminoglycoside phosphotransferase domain-containing protein n=1 Tax=Uncinocarpus reesii (strain UAMH 1704) TaxID=336963 RepID=C4JI65_UNCRE|nr:uncharacterized protein UREG_02811 [Uncinocarpus reesii 1704]EEP77962.1 predicted protein [Uncinocarpus reesii 1704]
MASTRRASLLRGDISLERALEKEENMIVRLQWPKDKLAFRDYLDDSHHSIQQIVSHHLGLSRSHLCQISHHSDWIYGGFNVCIPVAVTDSRSRRRFMLRCPLPYQLGSDIEEKLRCEAATFEYIRENCPDIPIPYLWGVGLPSGEAFTPLSQLPLLRRCLEHLRRTFLWLFRKPLPCALSSHPSRYTLSSGYLLMDYIDSSQGQLLSSVWPDARHDEELRHNFFKSLSRIILSLGRTPLPRIGSFTLSNDGVLSLTNRPLTLRLPALENEGIPTDIPRDLTYITVDSYLADILRCHDARLKLQPNAVNDQYDAEGQMAVLTIMRALPLTRRDLRHGPFVFHLTDLHPGNIFVDGQCNIIAVVDLEWGCSLPVEMVSLPYWLTGRYVDMLTGDALDRFNAMRETFMAVFAQEEQSYCNRDPTDEQSRTMIMKRAWEIGTYNLFHHHLQPIFAPEQCIDADEEDAKAIPTRFAS